MAVEVSITLPWALDEAASVGTAELVGSTGWILCERKRAQWWRRVELKRVRRRGVFFFFLNHPIRSKRSRLHSPHSWDSSEPSLQSLSWSHTKCLGMHWRFWHMNSLPLHVLLNTDAWKIFGEFMSRVGFYAPTGAVWILWLSLSLWVIKKGFNLQLVLTTASFDALISPVRTVFVSVALPKLRDTHMWPRTLERLGTAGFGLCDRKMLLKVISMSLFALSVCEYAVNSETIIYDLFWNVSGPK